MRVPQYGILPFHFFFLSSGAAAGAVVFLSASVIKTLLVEKIGPLLLPCKVRLVGNLVGGNLTCKRQEHLA